MEDTHLYSALQLDIYFSVAAATLYLYDLFITLDLEVELIWPSEWGFIKVMYLLQRYLPMIDTVILNRYIVIKTVRACERFTKVTSYLFFFGIMLSEAILTRRAVAVWENKRVWWITLYSFYVIVFVPMFITMGITMDHQMSFFVVPLVQWHCFASGGSIPLVTCWVLLTIFEAVIFVAIAVAGFRFYRSGCSTSSGLFVTVYRDGIIYYLYLFLLSTLNLFMILKYPGNYATLLSGIERVIHSSLTSRALLHIREQGQNTGNATTYFGQLSFVLPHTNADANANHPNPIRDREI